MQMLQPLLQKGRCYMQMPHFLLYKGRCHMRLSLWSVHDESEASLLCTNTMSAVGPVRGSSFAAMRRDSPCLLFGDFSTLCAAKL